MRAWLSQRLRTARRASAALGAFLLCGRWAPGLRSPIPPLRHPWDWEHPGGPPCTAGSPKLIEMAAVQQQLLHDPAQQKLMHREDFMPFQKARTPRVANVTGLLKAFVQGFCLLKALYIFFFVRVWGDLFIEVGGGF